MATTFGQKKKKHNLKNQIDWQINKPFDNA